MRCAIMQPTFLPWAGYFRMMAEVDAFCFLDDVQLDRQSWQTRNRVLLQKRAHWVTVPIRHAGLHQTIADTELLTDGGRWRARLARLLSQVHARHLYAKDLDELITVFAAADAQRLGDFNIGLITYCADRLGLPLHYCRSSELALGATPRTVRLLAICRALDCDTYLSPRGSASYLAADGFTARRDITLEFADYSPPQYPQKGSEAFVSHLSIVDVVANLGWAGAAHYVREPWPVMEQAT